MTTPVTTSKRTVPTLTPAMIAIWLALATVPLVWALRPAFRSG